MVRVLPFMVSKKFPVPATTGTSIPTLNTIATVCSNQGVGL